MPPTRVETLAVPSGGVGSCIRSAILPAPANVSSVGVVTANRLVIVRRHTGWFAGQHRREQRELGARTPSGDRQSSSRRQETRGIERGRELGSCLISPTAQAGY